jgi:hypothetical protein
MNNSIKPLAVGAGLLLAAASSNATVIITAQNGGPGGFGVSNTDLGQASGTTLSLDSGSASFSSSVGKLKDGSVYGSGSILETPESLTPAEGTVVTFHFDLTASPLGYDLTSIVSLTGTGQSRAQQVFDVSYSLVSGGGFTSLASVLGSLSGNNADNETRVTLSNLGLSQVADLRFTFHNGAGGEAMFREIDVIGFASVPEPSSLLTAGMLAGGGFAAVLLRRKRKAAAR